jgi:hypothetical protein
LVEIVLLYEGRKMRIDYEFEKSKPPTRDEINFSNRPIFKKASSMLEAERAAGGDICFPACRASCVNIEGATYAQAPSLKLILSRVVGFLSTFGVCLHLLRLHLFGRCWRADLGHRFLLSSQLAAFDLVSTLKEARQRKSLSAK